MIGVVVPIEGEAADRLLEVWSALSGLVTHSAHDVLHVSLHVAEAYDIDHVDQAIKGIARSQAPFTVYVAGAGVFTGGSPILHLVATRSPRLSVLHRVVGQEAGRFATSPDPNFHADRWVPHITLSREPLGAAVVGGAFERLAAQPAGYTLPVGALAILEDTPDGQRVVARYPLQG